ncbi:hypothetical protein H4R34_004292 [Dimargaris verticillata]|uniref:histidine kinase n=1 Tax=Dimargaris verticillata TaxID=2761393 RepID=A0A9W8AZ50_9FUNG|nr:hypothetical protein H4R34_004292 [Dimargaris verticillata]
MVRSPASTTNPTPHAEPSIQSTGGTTLWTYWQQLKHHLDYCSSEHQVALLCPSNVLPHYALGATPGVQLPYWAMLALTVYNGISELLPVNQVDTSPVSRAMGGHDADLLPEHRPGTPAALAKQFVFTCTDASRWVGQVINDHLGSVAMAQAATAMARMVSWHSITAIESLVCDFCDIVEAHSNRSPDTVHNLPHQLLPTTLAQLLTTATTALEDTREMLPIASFSSKPFALTNACSSSPSTGLPRTKLFLSIMDACQDAGYSHATFFRPSMEQAGESAMHHVEAPQTHHPADTVTAEVWLLWLHRALPSPSSSTFSTHGAASSTPRNDLAMDYAHLLSKPLAMLQQVALVQNPVLWAQALQKMVSPPPALLAAVPIRNFDHREAPVPDCPTPHLPLSPLVPHTNASLSRFGLTQRPLEETARVPLYGLHRLAHILDEGVVLVDQRGRICFTNSRFVELVGLDQAQSHYPHALRRLARLRRHHSTTIQQRPLAADGDEASAQVLYPEASASTSSPSRPLVSAPLLDAHPATRAVRFAQGSEADLMDLQPGSDTLSPTSHQAHLGPDLMGPATGEDLSCSLAGLPLDHVMNLFAVHQRAKPATAAHYSNAVDDRPHHTLGTSSRSSTSAHTSHASQSQVQRVRLFSHLAQTLHTGKVVQVTAVMDARDLNSTEADPIASSSPGATHGDKWLHGSDAEHNPDLAYDQPLGWSNFDDEQLEEVVRRGFESQVPDCAASRWDGWMLMLQSLAFPLTAQATPVDVTLVPIARPPHGAATTDHMGKETEHHYSLHWDNAPCMAVIITDLSKTLAVNAAKVQLDRKVQFFSYLSHEMRTPLSGITGIIELLLETPLNDEQKNLVNLFEYSSRTLQSLLDNILEFSKLEAQRVVLDLRMHRFRHIIDPFIGLAARWAQASRVQLHTEIDPRIPDKLMLDDQRLFQILSNLTTNALKFTRRDGLHGNQGRLARSAGRTSSASSAMATPLGDGGGPLPKRSSREWPQVSDEGQVTIRVRLLVDMEQHIFEDGPPFTKDHAFQLGNLASWTLAVPGGSYPQSKPQATSPTASAVLSAGLTHPSPAAISPPSTSLRPGGYSVSVSQEADPVWHAKQPLQASGGPGLLRSPPATSQLMANGSNHLPRLSLASPGQQEMLARSFAGDPFSDTSGSAVYTPATASSVPSPGIVAHSCRLLFEVIDNGIGISEENQAKLFQEYSQAERNTARRYGGTGIGLYISKQLVELFGGHIGVESEQGQGSRFYFTAWFRRQPAADATPTSDSQDMSTDYFQEWQRGVDCSAEASPASAGYHTAPSQINPVTPEAMHGGEPVPTIAEMLDQVGQSSGTWEQGPDFPWEEADTMFEDQVSNGGGGGSTAVDLAFLRQKREFMDSLHRAANAPPQRSPLGPGGANRSLQHGLGAAARAMTGPHASLGTDIGLWNTVSAQRGKLLRSALSRSQPKPGSRNQSVHQSPTAAQPLPRLVTRFSPNLRPNPASDLISPYDNQHLPPGHMAKGTPESPHPTPADELMPLPPPTRLPVREVRILLAEDDAVNRTIMTRHLQNFGFVHLDVVQDGAEALDFFAQSWNCGRGYHFVLLDMYMPKLNGIDVAQAIYDRVQAVHGSTTTSATGTPGDNLDHALEEASRPGAEHGSHKGSMAAPGATQTSVSTPVIPYVIGITADVDTRVSLRHQTLLSSILIKPFRSSVLRAEFEPYVNFE